MGQVQPGDKCGHDDTGISTSWGQVETKGKILTKGQVQPWVNKRQVQTWGQVKPGDR